MDLYHALFEGATHYDSTNLLLPSSFKNTNLILFT